MTIPFCEFCKSHYGGEYKTVNTEFGTILFIFVGKDCFKINLADKFRFGKYDVYHRNYGKRLDGSWPFHKQLQANDLSYGIFRAWTHEFDNSLSLPYDKDDYKRFMEDYHNALLQKSL